MPPTQSPWDIVSSQPPPQAAAGGSPWDIVKTEPPKPQPTPLQRLSEVTLGTQHPVDDTVKAFGEWRDKPMESAKNLAVNTAMTIPRMASAALLHPIDTIQNMTGGKQFAEDVQNKHYGNAAADVTGGVINTLGPVALGGPEALKSAGDTGARVLSKAGDVTSRAGQTVAEKVAGPIVRKPPAATANDLKFGRNPAEAITREPGLEGLTKSGLRDGLEKRIGELGSTADQILSTPQARSAGRIKISPIIDQAEQAALSSPEAKLNEGLETRIKNTADRLRTQFGELEKEPLEAARMKRSVGKAAKWTGQPFDNEANQFLVDVYRGINDQVNGLVPEVAPINERYADALSAKTAMDRKIAFDTNRPASIGRMALGAMGGGAATAGGAAMGGVPGAIAGGAVDLARTTPGRLTLGRTISKLTGNQYGLPEVPAPDWSTSPILGPEDIYKRANTSAITLHPNPSLRFNPETGPSAPPIDVEHFDVPGRVPSSGRTIVTPRPAVEDVPGPRELGAAPKVGELPPGPVRLGLPEANPRDVGGSIISGPSSIKEPATIAPAIPELEPESEPVMVGSQDEHIQSLNKAMVADLSDKLEGAAKGVEADNPKLAKILRDVRDGKYNSHANLSSFLRDKLNETQAAADIDRAAKELPRGKLSNRTKAGNSNPSRTREAAPSAQELGPRKNNEPGGSAP